MNYQHLEYFLKQLNTSTTRVPLNICISHSLLLQRPYLALRKKSAHLCS